MVPNTGSVSGSTPNSSLVAGQLPPHVAQGVLGAAALELVDHDRVGEVEHVDLLELAGGAELRRHHVQRQVAVLDDPGVALADARGLHDHEVEPGGPARGDGVVERLGHLAAPTGGHRAEEHLRRLDRVHADAVAEQRAAAAAPGGVDGQHRDPELVLLVEPEAADELVGERRLAGAAGAGDAEHRSGGASGRRPDAVEQVGARARRPRGR